MVKKIERVLNDNAFYYIVFKIKKNDDTNAFGLLVFMLS
jgi:hypothetical protein